MGNHWPDLPSFGPDGKPSSGISFTKGELTNAGSTIQTQVGRLDTLKTNDDQKLPISTLGFGVIGMGVQNVHETAVLAQKEALERARKALNTWEGALRDADDNYREADDQSGGPGDLGIPPGGGMPDLGSTSVPSLGSQVGDLPDTALWEDGPPNVRTPDMNVPGTRAPGVDPPGTGTPGADPPGIDPPGTDMPGTQVPSVEMPKPNLPGNDPADMRVPDIDSALNPDRTDLSAHQPTPPNVPVLDPTGTGVGTRTGTPIGHAVTGGPGTGVGLGTGVNGLAPGAAAALRGAAGSPGMPMMPMGGAGAGNNEERDRDKTVSLSEDEGIWGGDEDIAPQVIGQEDE